MQKQQSKVIESYCEVNSKRGATAASAARPDSAILLLSSSKKYVTGSGPEWQPTTRNQAITP